MKQTASLLMSSCDKPGLIAGISNFFKDRKLNIISFEQHSDEGCFFTRVEWEDDSRWKSPTDFKKEFSETAQQCCAIFDVRFFSKTQTIGLFVSKEPHALGEFLLKWELQEFPDLEVSFIISNDPDSEKFAKRYDIPFFYIPTKKDPTEHEAQQLKIIRKYKPDLIGLARYMKVLSKEFIDQAGCPIVNIHHSFLPSFVGAKPYEMAHEKGVKIIGATSHFVIPALDQGPIIEQDVTRIRSGYSIEKIKKIGRDTEKKVFVEAVRKVLQHKVIIYQGRTIVFE